MVQEDQFYRILVVEDNLGDFVLVEEYIRDYFFKLEIVNVTSYKELVKTITEDDIFDIIFLDLTLPDKFGIDLIKACTELIDSSPIVVLTGYPDFTFAKQTMSLGVSDYLLKEELSPITLHKCIIYNIERHKNIVKIKESEEYYQDLFQLSPNPLMVYDQNSRMILDVNDAAISTYQYTLEEFIGKKIEDFKVENTLFAEIEESLISISKGPKFPLDDIKCHQKKDGELLYVTYNKNRIIYKGIDSVILSVEDLTKEIIHIKSIHLQNKKLKEIAWIQSHIVRAPVARIMGLINLIVDDTSEAENQKTIYKMILDSSKELDDIIRNIVNKTNEV